jgi:hypothetical protein
MQLSLDYITEISPSNQDTNENPITGHPFSPIIFPLLVYQHEDHKQLAGARCNDKYFRAEKSMGDVSCPERKYTP